MVICFVEFLGTIGEFLLTNTKSNMRPRQRVLRQWFFTCISTIDVFLEMQEIFTCRKTSWLSFICL